MIKQLHKIIFGISIILFSSFASADDSVDIKTGFAFDMGFGVTALVNKKLNITLGNDGMAADYHIKQGEFNSKIPVTWYVGGGGYREWNDSFGMRLPLGLNLNLEKNLQNWNAYTQIAPDIGVDENDEVTVGAQLSLGLRYSF